MQEVWNAYLDITRQWQKPDILLVNGDCIDGNQKKSGSAELLTVNRQEQCDIAVNCIKRFNAKKILMTYGSGYHVGSEAEDYEFLIAQELGAEIGGHLFFESNGVVISAKHKTSPSNIYHGRATPLLREISWNIIKQEMDAEPKADIFIRSHVHYFTYVETPTKIGFTTPALQLSRGRYGTRECAGGETHWGAIRLTLHKGQVIKKDVICRRLVANKQKVLKV